MPVTRYQEMSYVESLLISFFRYEEFHVHKVNLKFEISTKLASES